MQRKNSQKLSPERKARLDAIGFDWDPFMTSWKEGFSKLQQFHSREGHCRVPHRHLEDGFSLGQWLSNMKHNKASQSPERLVRLEAIGFVWDRHESEWKEGLIKLQQFVAREGHSGVPQRYLEDGFKLGQWVSIQRRAMVKTSLAAERKVRLNRLGFIRNSFEAKWEFGFSKLRRYHSSEGHCRVPARLTVDSFGLGRWVTAQRQSKDTLSQERKIRLEALDFDWDPLTVSWEEGYNTLQQFHQREGHCRVPYDNLEDDFKLGSWVGTQRRRRGSLSLERIERLEALGFVWDTRTGNN